MAEPSDATFYSADHADAVLVTRSDDSGHLFISSNRLDGNTSRGVHLTPEVAADLSALLAGWAAGGTQ